MGRGIDIIADGEIMRPDGVGLGGLKFSLVIPQGLPR